MKVLLNGLQAANRSGTGRHTIDLAEALAASPNVDLTLLWPQGFPTPNATSIPRDIGGRQRLLDDQLRMDLLRRRAGADLVHYPANVGALRGSSPFVLTVHDLSFVRHPQWFTPTRARYYRFAASWSARRARRIIAVSHAAKHDLVKFWKLDPDTIDVIHNGVRAAFRPADRDAIAALKKELGLPERFVLFVGTLEPRKNIERIIGAWERAHADADVELVLVGRDGWKTESIHRAIETSPLRRHLHRRDHLPDTALPTLYSAARALVWPSHFEGFGLPPLEAMACGTPVITSRVSSLPEVCGDAALLVDPINTGEIAQAITRLADDETLHADLRQRGLERAAQFTWQRAAEETIATYRRALG